MSESYVGEIRMFTGNYAPAGWAFCNGQLLSISENEVLYSLIGTTYGGDGRTTFALPNLQGRIPIHQGNSYILGQQSGTETVTLTVNQLPQHTHLPAADTAAGDNPSPEQHFFASYSGKPYFSTAPNSTMNTSTASHVGGNQPHNNFMPYLTVNFIISLYGIYPSQG